MGNKKVDTSINFWKASDIMPTYAFYAKSKKEGEAIIENIVAANKKEAIKKSLEFAEKNDIHGYILMNRIADVVFAVDEGGNPV